MLDSKSAASVPEILRNALLVTTAEMKAVVMRTAYSTTWSEAGDLSCGVLSPDGEIVAQGESDIPVHLGTMPLSVQGCISALAGDIAEGDILIHNDPRAGNNHLPDFLLVSPVFIDSMLVAYAAVRAHWADVGGSAPGSLTTLCTDAQQEGLRVPPMHLARRNVLNEELVSLLLSNTRSPELVQGDMRAQLAGLQRGTERVKVIARRYGREVFQWALTEILRRSEVLMGERITTLPDGVYEFEDACDGDGFSDTPSFVRLRLQVNGSRMVADFSASDPQAKGGINCPYAVTVSAAYYAITAFVAPDGPINSGTYRLLEVRTREGTLTHSTPNAPIAGATGETANIIVDVVFGALSAAAPDLAVAAGSGTAMGAIYAGPRRESVGGGHGFYVEPHGSAWGARNGADGISGRRVGTGNAGNQPVEVIEATFPIHVHEYALAQDSAGNGRFRGGLPVRRRLEVLDDFVLTVTGERGLRPPHGLAGGENARCADLRINPGTEREQVLRSKTPPIELHKGDVVLLQAAGGGGYGDPVERPLYAVAIDIADGYVSMAAAVAAYPYEGDRLSEAVADVSRASENAEGDWHDRVS